MSKKSNSYRFVTRDRKVLTLLEQYQLVLIDGKLAQPWRMFANDMGALFKRGKRNE
jgi:hypothetical protein